MNTTSCATCFTFDLATGDDETMLAYVQHVRKKHEVLFYEMYDDPDLPPVLRSVVTFVMSMT